MKITDATLTLFSWESIPATIYGHHTAPPTGKSDLGLLAVMIEEGVTGHAFSALRQTRRASTGRV